MKTKILISAFALIFLVLTLHIASALIVDADYVTTYPGKEASVKINVENNFDYDIEGVSVQLTLDNVPFSSIGGSEKGLDDLDTDDDDSATFRLMTSTSAVPGDYDIPYTIRYINSDNSSAEQRTGSFGIRISAQPNVDFSVEKTNAIVGQTGKLSLNIINKGLSEVKFVSVQVYPQGYELLSTDKIYIGNIASDDTDFASFDVIFKSSRPVFSAQVTYKDFDNKDRTETINIPVEVYTQEQALQLGLIKQSRTGTYVGVIIGVLLIWYIWRKIKKRKKNNKNRVGGN